MLSKLRTHPVEIFACMFILLFVFWAIGYWCNALFNMKFDLPSCWAGFSVLSGAGVMVVLKYFADTFGNSPMGEKIKE